MYSRVLAIGLLFCVQIAAAQQAPTPAENAAQAAQQQPLDTTEVQRANQQQVTQRDGILQITDTIRGSREQPKVLSIVPWQPPRDKAALPSPFMQRIEQDFAPLSRDEFVRKVKHFERVSNTSQK